MEELHDVAALQRLLDKERSARKAAEELVEQKSQELAAIQQKYSLFPNTNHTHFQAEFQEEYPDPIFRIDLSGEIIYINTVAQHLLSSVPPTRIASLKRLFLNKSTIAHKAGKPINLETHLLGRYYLLFIVPLADKGYVNIYMNNITTRRQTELALEESRNFVRNIAHTIPNIIYIYDVEQDHCIYINEHLRSVLGYNEQDIAAMQGHVLSSILLPAEIPKINNQIADMLAAKDGEVREVQYEVLNKQGEQRSLFCRESVFKRKENGQVLQVIGSAEDVTVYRQYSKALKEQKDFYESIFNNITSDIAVYNADLRYTFVNPVAVSDPALREWIIGKTNEEYCDYRNVPLDKIKNRSYHL